MRANTGAQSRSRATSVLFYTAIFSKKIAGWRPARFLSDSVGALYCRFAIPPRNEFIIMLEVRLQTYANLISRADCNFFYNPLFGKWAGPTTIQDNSREVLSPSVLCWCPHKFSKKSSLGEGHPIGRRALALSPSPSVSPYYSKPAEFVNPA